MEIRWSENARSEIKELLEYIAQDSAERAINFTDRLIESVDRLKDFPHSGQVCPENSNLRQLVYEGYRIVYEVNNCIDILSVRAPGRNI